MRKTPSPELIPYASKLLPTAVTVLVLVTACTGRENARNLQLDGLVEQVCKNQKMATVNSCGARSVWLEADSGITAYVTVYGVETISEAKTLAEFLSESKSRAKQQIPVNLRIYSSPREQGRDPVRFLVYRTDI